MKRRLRKILEETAKVFAPLPPFEIERPKVKEHGELSTNLALILAKQIKKKPNEVAEQIAKSLVDPGKLIEKVSVAGAGFLNFVLKKRAWQESLREVAAEGASFGKSKKETGKKAVVEFVSANPTGPVHIGNARGGPLGDAIASLLDATGWEVTREFYVNDVGGQIDKLGKSVYHALSGRTPDAPSDQIEYQGSYIGELAARAATKLAGKLPEDVTEVERLLGRFGIDEMFREIRTDCEDIGIRFDSWIHEKTVLAMETGTILEDLKKNGVTLEKEGALWLATEQEDRESVLVRSDGRPTYFANDIAYHVGKYRRGFDRIVNVWGSNHHGHVPRVKAAVKSLGFDPEKIETVLYQYVRVKRGATAVKMSKRGGNFVTAREVLDEVGRDAFRFFLLMRAPESHLDFDLELAKSQTSDNPVYYVQYAHARLASIERKAHEAGIPPASENVDLSLLNLPEEIEMIRMIHEFPEEVERAASRMEPHRIPFYLLELVRAFQSYYTKAKEDSRYRVIGPNVDTSRAKLYLCGALKLTISQGLKLLGISAPDVMIQEKEE